jgi:hypothetical protein
VRVCWFLLLLCGCQSVLPDNMQPRSLPSDPQRDASADLIAYRTLKRADFRGTAFPRRFAGDDPGQFAAVTCVDLRLSPRLRIVARPSGMGEFEARAHGLGFVARMDRNCSWWNKHQEWESMFRTYVLQHEQIHFAIYEVHARDYSARADAIAAQTAAVADTAEAAITACQAKLDAWLAGELKRIDRRHTRFDEDTSYGYDTRRQQAWHELLQRQLEQTAR